MPIIRERATALPLSHPAFNVIASITRVYLRRELSRKERLEFLAEVADDLRWQLDAPNVVRIRPREMDPESQKAREEALAWWEAVAEKLAETAR